MSSRQAIMGFISLPLAFLLLATGSSLAQDCDFIFIRSSDGSNTRIQTRAGVSVIQKDPLNYDFLAYTKNGNDLTKVNRNGTMNVDNSSETNLNELLNMQLNGTTFQTSGGRLLIDSTNGNKWTLGSSKSARHLLFRRNSDMAALSYNSTNSTRKFTNIYVQDNSIVTLVDDQCMLETLPIDKLDNETQAIVASVMREASKDSLNGDSTDWNGQRFDQHFGFPPPPPPPFGGFHYPPPPPPFGGFHQPPPPPFGGFHQPPPPPFGGFHQPPPPPFGGFHQPPPSPFGGFRPQPPPPQFGGANQPQRYW